MVQNKEEKLEPKTQEDFEQSDSMRIGRIISTIIVVLFLVHPTITTISFNAFNCQNIDGKSRLFDDLEILCYKGNHNILSFGVAMPSIIIWGLGIPTIAFVLIYQNRKQLHLIDVKGKFGFLYSGYRNP